MLKRVQQTIHNHALLADNDTVIVGVSGGADSMALIDILRRASASRGYKLIIAHVIYGIRGNDAHADCTRVQIYAQKHNMLCVVRDLSTTPHPHNETWMRDARYTFFEKLRVKYSAQVIAVGHHRDDLVETFFLGLLRGSGLNGLGALRYQNDHVIRPLLGNTKQDILAYCEKHAIPYADDSTNTDTTYLRNRVRHDLLPYLRTHYTAQIDNIITRTAHSIRDDYTELETYAHTHLLPHIRIDKEISFAAADFCAASPSLQRMFLRIFAQDLTHHTFGFGTIENWRTLITSTKNKTQTAQTTTLILTKKGATVHMTART